VKRKAFSRVLNGAAGISLDMDLRLVRALGTSPGSWYAMQANHDMWQAQRGFRAKVRPINTLPATA
jgi:addiction module HigA family antidote